MAVIIPAFQIDNPRIAQIKTAAYENVQKIASAGSGGRDVVVRDINPTDLLFGPNPGANLAAAVTNPNALVANAWALNQFGNLTLLQNQAAAIYGWMSLTAVPHIKVVAFYRGNIPYATIPLQELYGFPQSVGYFNDVLYWAGGDTVRIDLMADAAVGANAEEFMPLGYISDPNGRVATDTSEGVLLQGLIQQITPVGRAA